MLLKTKRFLIFVSVFCFTIASFCLITYAHSGRTDANGGHYDHSTGEYHYHHGYPAHQHIDGECPYDYDDKTDHTESEDDSENNGITNFLIFSLRAYTRCFYIRDLRIFTIFPLKITRRTNSASALRTSLFS